VFPLNFAHPERLWWLLVLPLVVWLSLPSRPRRVVWTAHLPQWLAAQRSLRRRPRRVRGLRLLLALIAAAAAAVAFAGPTAPGRAGPTRLVVLLDASASMAAAGPDAGSTPFERARAALRPALAAVPGSVEVTLLRVGGPLLRRHGSSARALHDLGAPAGPATAALAELAAAVATPDTAVWTLTDGQGQPTLPATGALTVLGEPGPNGSLLAVRTTDRWPLPQFDVAVDVVLHGETALVGTLRAGGAAVAPVEQGVALQPGVVATVSLSLQRTASGGPCELVLDVPGDRLPTDDRWSAELPPLPAPRIAVLAAAEAGPFAAVAASALAAEVGGEVVPGAPGAEVGLLLVDGGTVDLPPGEVRALGFGAAFRGAADATPWLQPVVADWDRQGAMTAGLDLSELRITRAYRGVLPAGEPFLWGAEPGLEPEPLAVVAGSPGLASVHFGFRLQDSNLPLLPAFPQLLRRAFLRCYGTDAKVRRVGAPPPAGEQDLWNLARGADRPLPEFASPERDLAPWLLFGGLIALVLRGFLR
jgi:hypothetical protein